LESREKEEEIEWKEDEVGEKVEVGKGEIPETDFCPSGTHRG
jgi:hypothetical protein